MMFNKYLILTVAFIGLMSASTYADINRNKPPFSLTLAQVEQWSPSSTLADKNNVSSVPLKKRFVAELGNNKQPLDSEVKVLIAPDGMNNFANYLKEQNKFNLYNFTHWSHIDVLNWFAGTANETVSLPSRPWVETAHKNGVKVIGTVYLSVAQYGGNVETVARLLQQDANGEFPLARKLIAMADFYGFDGWLINPETNLTYVKNAKGEVVKGEYEYKNAALLAEKMQVFMQYLTRIAPPAMEIHWYDSMLLDGSVKWQNELNAKNAPFLQNGEQRMSDAMFMNYWWDSEMAEASRDYAEKLGRSRYELYFGADLSPARNAQRLFERGDWLKALFPSQNNKQINQAVSSIALFGNDVNYTFTGNNHTKAFSNFRQNENDYRRFYDTETRLFAGDDLNLYNNDDNAHWSGIGRFVPAKSTLTQLPFNTSFNTGHGLFKAEQGKPVSGQWHDIAQQDILPTWQFAVDGNKATSVFYDFESAYMGGNSLAITSEKNQGISTIPLYQSLFLLKDSSELSITYQYSLPNDVVNLWLELDHDKIVYFPLTNAPKSHDTAKNNWFTVKHSLKDYQHNVVTRIGFSVGEHLEYGVAINIGLMEIH